MNKEKDIQQKLKHIAQSEDDRFEFDDIEIGKEYVKMYSDKSSLAIKILTVAGGLSATLAILGFLFLAGLYDSKMGLIVAGIIFIGLAIWLNVVFNKLILGTLSVSAYISGYCLLVLGLGEINVDENTISFIVIIISLTTLGTIPNYILSFISILIINGSLLFIIVNNHFYNIIHIYNAFVLFLLTYIFLNEAKLITRYKRISKLYNAVRMGLLVSVLSGLVFVGNKHLFDFTIYNIWGSSLITIPLTIYVISVIIKVIGVSEIRTKLVIYTLSTFILLPTAFSPAISGSLLIILLSYFVSYRMGLSIGVIAFIYFVSQYYYDLNFTLLTKSILLFSSGIVFLLFYGFTIKKLGSNEKL